MNAALREARKGLGQTSPNPAVGAVLVVGDKIIARGHHRMAGAPHAEVECLSQLPRPLGLHRRAKLYLTLEPCSTSGRTGPCTDVILQSGIKTVIIGAIDPNPRHNGRGVALLKAAGITVRLGILADECTTLNEAFNKWIVTGTPFVIAKCGMTLDGHLTRRRGESRWITGVAARRHAHELRARVDAILVGAETVRRDDPKLTIRHGHGGKQPYRVVVTRSGNLPTKARLLRDRFKKRTLIYRNQSLSEVLSDLGRKEVTSVLIEGGGRILGEALDNGLVDQVQICIGPLVTGGPVVAFSGQGYPTSGTAPKLARIAYRNLGTDICITGYPSFNGPHE